MLQQWCWIHHMYGVKYWRSSQWAEEVQSLGISPAAGSCIRVAAGGEAAGCSNWGMFFIYLCKELVLAWIGTLMSSGN